MRAMPRVFPRRPSTAPARAGKHVGARDPVAANCPRYRAHGALLRRAGPNGRAWARKNQSRRANAASTASAANCSAARRELPSPSADTSGSDTLQRTWKVLAWSSPDSVSSS